MKHASKAISAWSLRSLAAAALLLAWWRLGSWVINPVSYAVTPGPRAELAVWMIGPAAALAAAGWLIRLRCRLGEADGSARTGPGIRAAAPALALIALAALSIVGVAPSFWQFAILIIATAWAVQGLASLAPAAAGAADDPPRVPRVSRFAPLLLGLAVLASTAWHALAQVNFWRHFMLGYADFGFFTTELEHCLPWADVADRFGDTRMGYHCIPFFYVLAPCYALVRSPVFLMVVGPLALNLAVFAFYDLARRVSGSAGVGLLVGLAWLLLPSIARLPYANTYGFQSIYLAVPWLAFALDFGLTGRWKWSHVCLAVALLCEETVCGVAFGWGIYLLVFTPRRRDGALIIAVALAYLALTTQVIIPHFASAQTYTRVKLFGDVNAAELLQRLLRPRGGWYLLALTAPLLVGMVRAPRLLIAAAPPLVLVLILQNPDWLNLKYWHQSSALPVLFAASVVGAVQRPARPPGLDRAGTPYSGALGLFTAALLMHQALGYSPITRAYALQQHSGALAQADPRLEAVRHLRNTLPRQSTILATERLAAHFTDYRGVYPGHAPGPVDVVLVDTRDNWDTSGLAQRVPQLLADHGCQFRGELAGIQVLVCPDSGTTAKP